MKCSASRSGFVTIVSSALATLLVLATSSALAKTGPKRGRTVEEASSRIANLVDLTDRVVRVRTLTGIRIDPDTAGGLIYEYSFGTGVVLPEHGLLATAYHNVRQSSALAPEEREVAIMTRNTAGYMPVDVIAEDPSLDLAILRANPRVVDQNRYFVPSVAGPLPLGSEVYAIGFRASAPPESFEVGIIAGQVVDGNAQLVQIGGQHYEDKPWLSVSQQILPGYSGGAILNTDGELAGILVGAPFHEDSWTDFSFGISVVALHQLLEKVLERDLTEGLARKEK